MEGFYPIGSMSLRVRMWTKGFMANGISTKLVIVAPPPTLETKNNSEDFVHFLFKPILKQTKINMISYLLYRIIGAIKLRSLLMNNKDIDFVIISRPNILIGFLLKGFCKKNGIKFFFDKGDENARLVDRKVKSFTDFLAKNNHQIFDKYIIPYVDTLFVVSSYLENKYKTKLPHLKVKRSLPTLLNYNEFKELQETDLNELSPEHIQAISDVNTKIFYAGSCERTNGLFFFLDCVAAIKKTNSSLFKVIFIFVDGDIEKVKDYCEMLNIIDCLTFLPPVLPRYMPAIYKYVDILILPEQGDIIANAGFPGKTGEYLASGKAILSTIFSDLTDYLKHDYNALLAKIGDKEAYTNNLIRLLANKDLRDTLGQNAIKTAIEEFDYKRGMFIYSEEL